MAVYSGPKVTTDGLILHLDKYNEESYQGEPSTNLVYYTGLDTGWSKGYNTNIVWNDIDPPDGIDSPVVGFNDAGYPSSEDGAGYWYSYGDYCPQDPSTQYSISLYVKTDVTSTVTVHTYTADNSEAGRYWSNAQTLTASDGWKRLEWNFTSASNAESDSLSFWWSGVTEKLWLCAPQMEANPHATKYIKSNDNGTTTTRSATDGWRDLSGNNNHADLTSLTYSATKVPGTLVNDFSFDGTNDKAVISPYITYSDGQSWTFTAWAYCTSGDSNPTWEALTGSDSADGFIMLHSDFRIYFRGNSGDQIYSDAMSSNYANRWVNIVVRSDGTNIHFYVNGVSHGGGSNDTWMRFNHIGMGQSNRWFQGKISNYMVYNRNLSAIEVLQNFNASKGRYGL